MEKSRIETGNVTGSRVASQAKWTFMVYMAGDNNLDGAALRDIGEIARAGSTKNVSILVQLDRIEDNLTRRFRITQGGDPAQGEFADDFLAASIGDGPVRLRLARLAPRRVGSVVSG
jgi:hypothetical protein